MYSVLLLKTLEQGKKVSGHSRTYKEVNYQQPNKRTNINDGFLFRENYGQ